MDSIGLGKVTKVNEDFSIEFEIPGVAEECVGYPMWGESEPEVDDSIIWFRLDAKLLGESFIYKKLYIEGDFYIKVGKYELRINKDDGITMKSEDGGIIELKGSTIDINNGNLKVVL